MAARKDVPQGRPGSSFPALRRHYAITNAGRRQLAKEEQHWKAITIAVARVLEGA